MKFYFLIISLILFSGSCKFGVNEPDSASEDNPSKLFINGKIYTVNDKQPWADAVYVEDGSIKFVGTNEDAKKQASRDAEIIDLEGRMMMPGIHDVHTHPVKASSPFIDTCLLDSEEEDAEQFIPLLEECKGEQRGTDWVLGSGHSVYTLLEAERPPVEILDEAVPDRPAIMLEATSHSVWVNSKALKLAKIGKDTPDPNGGIIVKDPKTGKPNGILLDAAGDPMINLAWRPTVDIKELNYEGLIDSMSKLNENGITSVCEAGTNWNREFQTAWLRAEKEGTLTVRAVLGLSADPNIDDAEQIGRLKALYRNKPDSLVRISQIKIYSDGILINSTAAMLEPYTKALDEVPAKTGLTYFTEGRIARYITELEPAGFDFHIHAIGDRGVRESLNAIEKGQKGKGRHRITHLEIIKPDDFERFRKLNVTADMQVSGDFTNPENWKENESLIGGRSNNLVPLRSLFDAGARITLSCDWNISYLSPFVGIQNALTREPQNLPSLKDAIRSYTLLPAFVMRQEDKTGSIEAGKEADLIVLDQNLFEIEIDQISKTKVLMTFLAGRNVYQADE